MKRARLRARGKPAWFDIVLDWGTRDLPYSLLSAGLGELPLAFLLLYTARRVIRLSLQAAWSRSGRAGLVPPLARIPLLISLPPEPEGCWGERNAAESRGGVLMIGKLQCVVLDCHYPAGLAHFYAAVLGGEVDRPDPRWSLDEEWSTLHTPDGTVLGFQRVEDYRPPMWPDPAHPQQMHLDIQVEDPDAAEARVLELGAELKDRETGWRVYLDPAGHPFCLVQAAQPAA